MDKRPAKEKNLTGKIIEAVKNGRYFVTKHAEQRFKERNITRLDVEYVLQNGHHRPQKDSYDDFERAWNYAIEGNNADLLNLRIIVSFDQDDLLIITVINIGKI